MRNLLPVVFLGAVLEENLCSCSLFLSLNREQKPKITEGFTFHAGFPVCQPGAGGITCVHASSSSEQEQMDELAETTAITSLFVVILVSCLQHELILPKLATKILNSNWLCGVSRVNSKDTRPLKGGLFLLTTQGVNWATDTPAFFQEV